MQWSNNQMRNKRLFWVMFNTMIVFFKFCFVPHIFVPPVKIIQTAATLAAFWAWVLISLASLGRGVIANAHIKKVETFKYLGSLLTNQNSIPEEIKCRLKAGNSCYYSVKTLLSSRLHSKNLKIKIYKTIM